jgi:hypothetical protein
MAGNMDLSVVGLVWAGKHTVEIEPFCTTGCKIAIKWSEFST